MTPLLVSAADRPGLVETAEAMSAGIWPEWLDTRAMRSFWRALYGPEFAPYQTFALDADGGVIAIGNAVPFLNEGTLPDTGWDWVLEAGVLAARNNAPVNSLSALAVTIRPDHRGDGLAVRLLERMKALAVSAGLGDMVAPVRPTLKSRYPLQDFTTYCDWRRPDGLPFDPWLRTHERLGAKVIGPAMQSMTVEASIADWERWTGLRFPTSGNYAIVQALAPLNIDLDSDIGRYCEPNLWMRHPLA